jgi:hypothetical protein
MRTTCLVSAMKQRMTANAQDSARYARQVLAVHLTRNPTVCHGGVSASRLEQLLESDGKIVGQIP